MSRQNVRTVFIAGIVLAVAVAGCMPGPNPLKGTPIGGAHAAGFWLGLWHGLLGPMTFVMSLFKDGTGFYEVHNNGGWYNAGFLLGFALVLGGGSFQGKVQFRKGSAPPADEPVPSGGPSNVARPERPSGAEESASDRGDGSDAKSRSSN